MTDETNPLDEEKQALDRIATTHDGRLLHRYLRRILETCADFTEPHTLQAQNGRRSLARDLMVLMREGMNATGRTDPGNDPILTRKSGPVLVSARAKRDPNRFPRVDSYGDNRNPDGSDPGAKST